MLSTAGLIWACGYGEADDVSAFSPEFFVQKEYNPFFYDTNHAYYSKFNTNDNYYNRYRESDGYRTIAYKTEALTADWDGYLNHDIAKQNIYYLLFKASMPQIDSVRGYLQGSFGMPPSSYPLTENNGVNKKIVAFFNYLHLAKACEKFALRPVVEGWNARPDTITIVPGLDATVANAFNKAKDPFIKEHLWFQYIRLKYFEDETPIDTTDNEKIEQRQIVTLFNSYKSQFPKNLIYYRTMGYLAGYYYQAHRYAQSNYLYSLCFNANADLKISSFWSFHPQNETDWNETLKLAKNNDEQVTLWQMLGIYDGDERRAIKQIVKLNPTSGKTELLLTRLINGCENAKWQPVVDYTAQPDATKQINPVADKDIKLVDSVSTIKNVNKPYLWHLASGYLHYLNSDYKITTKFYALAKTELPKGDTMIQAQYKVLSIMLDVSQVKQVDAAFENRMIEPLTWLSDLKHGKKQVPDLRFNVAVTAATDMLAAAYQKKGERLKALCFNGGKLDVNSYDAIDTLVRFINKHDKSPFEVVMAGFMPYRIDELYFTQAVILTYREGINHAITLMDKTDQLKTAEFGGNPFNSRLNDCRDCDYAAPQKRKYTQLSFLQTLKMIKDELKAGHYVYRNAFLMANAYYNISGYGNAINYSEDMLSSVSNSAQPDQATFPDTAAVVKMSSSQALAEKYYKMALRNATTNEQRARCTFMLSKCERNRYYNNEIKDVAADSSGYPPASQYFVNLKTKYARTSYYAEVIKECGYFRHYLDNDRMKR